MERLNIEIIEGNSLLRSFSVPSFAFLNYFSYYNVEKPLLSAPSLFLRFPP